MTGRIDRLFADRGFGFIETEDRSRIFFHLRHLRGPRPFEDLVVGERVQFDVEIDRTGRPAATNVIVQ